MKKILSTSLLVFTLSSCSALDVIGGLLPGGNDGISVDAELTVGDKQENINADVSIGEETTNNTNTAEVINNNVEEAGTDYFMFVMFLVALIVAFAALIAPTPSWICKGCGK